MHGNGVWNDRNGSSYEGEWVDNLKEGLGVFRWPDGSRYEGNYKGGKRYG